MPGGGGFVFVNFTLACIDVSNQLYCIVTACIPINCCLSPVLGPHPFLILIPTKPRFLLQ